MPYYSSNQKAAGERTVDVKRKFLKKGKGVRATPEGKRVGEKKVSNVLEGSEESAIRKLKPRARLDGDSDLRMPMSARNNHRKKINLTPSSFLSKEFQ